jgi:hypothetical protein
LAAPALASSQFVALEKPFGFRKAGGKIFRVWHLW